MNKIFSTKEPFALCSLHSEEKCHQILHRFHLVTQDQKWGMYVEKHSVKHDAYLQCCRGRGGSLARAPSERGPPNSAELVQIPIPVLLLWGICYAVMISSQPAFCFALMLLGCKLQCRLHLTSLLRCCNLGLCKLYFST